MQHILELKAFFFNAQTDYLPYYKHFEVTLDSGATAAEMLAKIKEQNENFSFPEENLLFRINGLVVTGEQKMDEVIERLGSSLQIDPVNAYRSNNGLVINDDDFMQSYALLAPYASEEDLAYYQSLYALHYASETEKFDHSYIGDAVLLLAHRMIEAGTEHKEAVLKAVTEVPCGLLSCEYENNLFKAEEHSETIAKLKSMLKYTPKPSLMETLAAGFMKKSKKKSMGSVDLEGKQIAYYTGEKKGRESEIFQKIADANAKAVSFSKADRLAGLSLLESDRKLAYTKAGATLLDALDSGAQILVVEEEEVLSMFLEHFSAIESALGREIDMALVSADEFVAQVNVKAA